MYSQVDNRNQSAGKRARTDGGRREDDWTCPNCGNVNFAFRMTCNMRNCNQSRPTDHNTKPLQKPLQTPPFFGSATPTSMYLGAPQYASSLFSPPAVPRYELPPYAGGSAYPYGYGARLSIGSPYGAVHLSGPPPYSSSSLMGPGGIYGMPPLVDRFGLGLQTGHAAMGARAGNFLEENSQKKTAGAGRDNDWKCPNCGNINFAFRTVCNMRKCNTPRPENQGSKFDGSKGSKPKMPEGSWKCEKCNNINYPFRTKCNRQNCGAEKPSQSSNANEFASDEDNQ